jgi:hypothetical protein
MIIIYDSINEWKESANYLFAKWFDNIKKDVEEWFKSDTYKDFEYDYFEYDSAHNGPIYVAFVYFNESNIQWKLEIILDSNELSEDDTIDNISIQLFGYDKKGGKTSEDLLGELAKDLTEPELNPDLLFELISEFKDKFMNNEDEQQDEEQEDEEQQQDEEEKETEIN